MALSKLSRTRQVTMAAALAAVYFVLRSIPTFQMVGISGRFTAGDFLLTTIALVAGLWSGALSVLIGTVLAYGMRPPTFFGLDFLPALVNVTIAALLLSNRHRIAQGVYTVILIAYLASPYSLLLGYAYVPYTWLHIVALAVLLSPIVTRIPTWLARDGPRQIAALALLAFVATMAQHLSGGLLYEFAVGFIGGIRPTVFKQFWSIIFWLYPLERLFIAALSTVISVAIWRSLRRWTV